MSEGNFLSTKIKSDSLIKRFNELNISKRVLWETEWAFAVQQITKSPKILLVAENNPVSVKSAILNVAAVGITLNPVCQYAYLVPRSGQICLDISYRGLIKKATDSGAIKWGKSILVHEKDKFKWKGICSLPLHDPDYFGERGKVIGGYCVAKLNDGSFMVEAMSLADIKKIQAKSPTSSGPWASWWEEMAKKSIIKRAAKTWPQIDDDCLNKAISVLNEHEGILYNNDEHVKEVKTSGVSALEDMLSIDETNDKGKDVVLDVTKCDLILDEIEASCDDKGLSGCIDKIDGDKDLSEDDKNKLRTAYQTKQREIEHERGNN